MDNSLVDVGINDFDLLGSLVSGQLSLGLSSSLGIGVEVGDDTYNEIVADLSNNTTNSSYWNNIDASTKSNINTMYNNLKNSFDNILFTPDGLALGALMMARCMNSLGTPINPVGGSRGGMCIMQQRIKLSKKR